MTEGKIVKGIGGIYEISLKDGNKVSSSIRGKFRYKNILPLVGDNVILGFDNDTYVIEKILDRKNELVRPPVANLDQLFVVIAATDPKPDLLYIDKLIVLSEYNDIEPVLLINKMDLDIEYCNYLKDIYDISGFDTLLSSAKENIGLEKITNKLRDKTSCFAGPSGVGKSSLINHFDDDINMETKDISKKIGRGRHTTRHVELFALDSGFVLDTPGFTSLNIDHIKKDQLKYLFREFEMYNESCKFRGCAHIHEPGCVVKDKVNEKKIHISRYENYKAMYFHLSSIKEWD